MTSSNAPTSRSSTMRRILALCARLGLVTLIVASIGWIVPSLLGYDRYVITGGSMSGAIERGSVVFEKPVPVEDLVVGDVITYVPPADSGVHNLVTHRIVEMETTPDGLQLLRTQGDANPDPDPWQFSLTAPTQPVVEFTVPVVGYAFTALADPDVRMLIIGVPAGLVALLAGIELVRAVRQTKPIETDAPPKTQPVNP